MAASAEARKLRLGVGGPRTAGREGPCQPQHRVPSHTHRHTLHTHTRTAGRGGGDEWSREAASRSEGCGGEERGGGGGGEARRNYTENCERVLVVVRWPGPAFTDSVT